MQYGGSNRWNMVKLALLMPLHSKYVRWVHTHFTSLVCLLDGPSAAPGLHWCCSLWQCSNWAVLKTWLPPALVLLGLVLLLLLVPKG